MLIINIRIVTVNLNFISTGVFEPEIICFFLVLIKLPTVHDLPAEHYELYIAYIVILLYIEIVEKPTKC